MTEHFRLTDAFALASRPRDRKFAIHDSTLQGFVLRVQPNGTRSWVFRFHRDGKPRRVIPGKPELAEANQAWGAQCPWSRNSTSAAKSKEARTGAQPCQPRGPTGCVT